MPAGARCSARQTRVRRPAPRARSDRRHARLATPARGLAPARPASPIARCRRHARDSRPDRVRRVGHAPRHGRDGARGAGGRRAPSWAAWSWPAWPSLASWPRWASRPSWASVRVVRCCNERRHRPRAELRHVDAVDVADLGRRPCPAARRRRWRASAPRSSAAARRRTARGQAGGERRASLHGAIVAAVASARRFDNGRMSIQTDEFAPARPSPAAPLDASRRQRRARLAQRGGDRARAAAASGSPSTSARPRRASSSRSSSARRAKRGEALDHVLLFGPPGLGKTTLVAHHRQRARREPAPDLGAGAREARGPRGAPDQPRDARRALHRRDPSPLAGGRGDPLSGAGGLPDRHHDRRGPGGALDQARPAAVHADRRDDARRHADQPAARPLRHRRAARVLQRRGAGADRAPLGAACSTCRSTPTARVEIARRSRGTPRIANRLLRRVRDFAEVKGDGTITRPIADAALAMLDVDPHGFDVDGPQAARGGDRPLRRRPGRRSTTSPRRSARSATRSRT